MWETRYLYMNDTNARPNTVHRADSNKSINGLKQWTRCKTISALLCGLGQLSGALDHLQARDALLSVINNVDWPKMVFNHIGSGQCFVSCYQNV